jgi:hypothetical protein
MGKTIPWPRERGENRATLTQMVVIILDVTRTTPEKCEALLPQ